MSLFLRQPRQPPCGKCPVDHALSGWSVRRRFHHGNQAL